VPRTVKSDSAAATAASVTRNWTPSSADKGVVRSPCRPETRNVVRPPTSMVTSDGSITSPVRGGCGETWIGTGAADSVSNRRFRMALPGETPRKTPPPRSSTAAWFSPPKSHLRSGWFVTSRRSPDSVPKTRTEPSSPTANCKRSGDTISPVGCHGVTVNEAVAGCAAPGRVAVMVAVPCATPVRRGPATAAISG